MLAPLLHRLVPARPSYRQAIHSSAFLCKNIRAGVPKSTRDRTLALSYERACRPEHIGVRKTWTCWNTGNLHGEKENTAWLTSQDIFVRTFIGGTWIEALKSEVIIKRQHNTMRVAFIVDRRAHSVYQYYYLIGYSEELLSQALGCPVKLELQTVASGKDVVFTYT